MSSLLLITLAIAVFAAYLLVVNLYWAVEKKWIWDLGDVLIWLTAILVLLAILTEIIHSSKTA